jgi:hypothetical protein
MSPDDIQAGSLVTIQGDFFMPGADEVRITQATTQTIKAGSPYWSDFESQIKLVLPTNLEPGPANVRVVADGLVSNAFKIDVVSVDPRVNSVVNPNADYTTEKIKPGSLVAIFGDRFTPGTDKVVVTQNGNSTTLQAGSLYWYDSPNQINVVLPESLGAGEAQVKVVNASGRQSAPVTIPIVGLRPVVNAVQNPVTWTSENLQPRTLATIFGDNFTGSDTVLLTQAGSTRTIQAGSPNWYDSANQINFQIPGDLQPGEAIVRVANNRGGVSAPVTIEIVSVSPRINEIVNPNFFYLPENIKAGSLVTIFGDRFTLGDSVLVSQGGAQYTIGAGSPSWYDSYNQINFRAPAALQPGEAEVRVVNINGVQSDPKTITIVP